VEGVQDVSTDMEKHIVAIAFDDAKTNAAALRDALTKGDYPPQGEPRTLASMPAAGPERMIVGKTSQGNLFRDYPVFWNPYRDYNPRKDVVEKISGIRGSHDILVFFGTWCKDSISEVPKILRALDAAGNKDLKLALYGVDRSKKEGLGMSEKFNIQRVPTTIVLRDGVELGRIVEYPEKSNEEDLLKILEKK
jgi:thiol-disulfide isomerase/thioredoxin/copper chaperone CopZ